MPIARDVKPATLNFVLGGNSPLARHDALLACVAAVVADGSFRQSREIILFALKDGVAPALVREAILHVAPLAGVVRAETGLAALEKAAEELERPSDPLAQLLGGPQKKGGDAKDALDAQDEKPAGDAVKMMKDALGDQAGEVEGRLARRSRTLARWVKDALFAGAFGRGGLAVEKRVLLTVAALYPLDARPALETWLRALEAKGMAKDALWTLQDVLARLFQDGAEAKSALSAFEAVLGRKARDDEFAPGKDPFRWD
jgi:alkylhydroperoxidase/carboxymuconolactone decarboxylase family protein YurZ